MKFPWRVEDAVQASDLDVQEEIIDTVSSVSFNQQNTFIFPSFPLFVSGVILRRKGMKIEHGSDQLTPSLFLLRYLGKSNNNTNISLKVFLNLTISLNYYYYVQRKI